MNKLPTKRICSSETHHACDERLKEYASETLGCCCVGHGCGGKRDKAVHEYNAQNARLARALGERTYTKEELIALLNRIEEGIKAKNAYYRCEDGWFEYVPLEEVKHLLEQERSKL